MESVPIATQLRDPRGAKRKLADSLLGVQREQRPSPVGPLEDPADDKIGICCSGGGIRSASYNLGALQVLKEEGIFDEARYLAGVSGGSYIAASHAIIAAQTEPELLDKPIYAKGSPEEQFLRSHSSYMAPGFAGKVRIMLRVLMGLVVNIAFIGVALFLAARVLGWAYAAGLHPGLSVVDAYTSVRPWMWAAAIAPLALGLYGTLLELMFRLQERTRQFVSTWSTRFLLVGAGIFAVLIGLPWVVHLLRDFVAPAGEAMGVAESGTPKTQASRLLQLISGILASGVATGTIRALVAKARSRIATIVGGVVAPVALFLVFIIFLNDASYEGWRWSDATRWAILAVAFGGVYVLSDLTQWSMHPYYKRRLSSAFATHRVRDDDGEIIAKELPYDQMVRLSQSQPPNFPELIVCAAANISDQGATPTGRNATTFTFTAKEIGGPLVGTIPTADFEAAVGLKASDITVPAAVAISGAALSPSMGKMTKRSLTFLLALANVRLGVWMPNPRWKNRWSEVTDGRRRLPINPRPVYLVKELLGWNKLDDKFLYVTDGGHYENLGLIELLRRGCTTIYCFDASGDEVDTFHTLGQAMAIARVDLLVDIDIEPKAMAPDEKTGYSGTDHVVGSFIYPDGTTGKLIFVKAAVTKDAPWDVRAFQEKDPRFPTHSTADQLFDEGQFEAYRALGEHSTSRAVAAFRALTEEEEEVGHQAPAERVITLEEKKPVPR
ncbi:MAG: patatin-like phospholipase family protein [Actinomycetota bacterium]